MFAETHEVRPTMLWGFVIVIKRNGTDGSTFPMVNEVRRILGNGICDWRELFCRNASWDEERAAILESSSLLFPRNTLELKYRPSTSRFLSKTLLVKFFCLIHVHLVNRCTLPPSPKPIPQS